MSATHIAARVIAAIGRPDFPEALLSVYRDLAGCNLCSAFQWEDVRGPRLLFATGDLGACARKRVASGGSDPSAQRKSLHDIGLLHESEPPLCPPPTPLADKWRLRSRQTLPCRSPS